MFVYKEWERFCSNLYNLDVECITALEALGLSKTSSHYIIIKHDIETNLEKALHLALIENKFDIKATYYVQSYLLDDAKNVELLRVISELGHEVTYHYDVLDANDGDYKLAEEEFDQTLSKFSNIGLEVKTVCPHGNPIKERDGWSSNKDFFRKEHIRNKYSSIVDIVISPEKFINRDMVYISDAGFGWKKITDISNNDKSISDDLKLEGLDDVIALIDKTKTVIVSAHPHRWRKYSIIASFNKNLFLTLRFIVKKLTRISFLNKIMSKFYYLAKKI